MALAACRGGGTQWKTRILRVLILAGEFSSSACTMDMAVSFHSIIFAGNEVAEWVRDHLIGILTGLSSFKSGNYEECLKELYIKIDKLLQTDKTVKNKLKDYRTQPRD